VTTAPPLPRSAVAGLSACIDVLRAQTPSGREPWSGDGPPYVPPGPEWSLAALVHLGRSIAASELPAGWRAALEHCYLATGRGDRLAAGRWEVTAHRGILAVRDRPGRCAGAVYLGEDGLTFLDAVLQARPRGDVLEVGSGSGLISAGAARTARCVTAVDVVPACLEATRLTASLNGVADRVVSCLADLTSVDFPQRFAGSYDCVVANLPGVPVPPTLAYSPAGDGGPDGLRLIRHLLQCAPALLRTGARRLQDDAALLMRFQSLGTDAECFLLADIRSWASEHGFDAVVTYTSRAPVEVRNGLTATYAVPLNPGIDAKEILQVLDAHAAALGATQYYSATLSAQPGAGRVDVIDAAPTPPLDVRFQVDGAAQAVLRRMIDYRFLPELSQLPEGFWELGSIDDIEQVVTSAPALLDLLADGSTAREAIRDLFGGRVHEHPAARSRLSAATALLNALIVADLVRPLSPVESYSGTPS
jgi:methylase of polypeptide subunit release factors